MVPGIGYWAKVAAGKHVTQIPLPPISGSTSEGIRIYGARESRLPGSVQQAKGEAIAGEKAPEKKITVNSASAAFHPTVALTRKALRKQKPDQRGLVTSWGPRTLPSRSRRTRQKSRWHSGPDSPCRGRMGHGDSATILSGMWMPGSARSSLIWRHTAGS